MNNLDVYLARLTTAVRENVPARIPPPKERQLRHRQGQLVTRPAVSRRGGSKTGPGRRGKSSLVLHPMSIIQKVERPQNALTPLMVVPDPLNGSLGFCSAYSWFLHYVVKIQTAGLFDAVTVKTAI